MVIDLKRCGQNYCGRLFQKEGRCGQQVLNVEPAKETTQAGDIILTGTFNVSKDYGTYTVGIIIGTGGGKTVMKMIGGNRSNPIFSRNMPVNLRFERVGVSSCGPLSTSSIDAGPLDVASR